MLDYGRRLRAMEPCVSDEPLLSDDLLDETDPDTGSPPVLEARIELKGVRLDKALAVTFPTLSRARLQALLTKGAVTCDGQPVSNGSAKVLPGLYAVKPPPLISATPLPQAIPLTVLFEDAEPLEESA